MKKFLRRNSDRHSKLGRNRRKKQTWRKPKGRHNKMRDKRRGYPAIVKVGYKNSDVEREKINGMVPVLVMNVKNLGKIKSNEVGIIGNVGKKKKIEIVQKAKESKIKLHNVNIEKFLEKNKMKTSKTQENKK